MKCLFQIPRCFCFPGPKLFLPPLIRNLRGSGREKTQTRQEHVVHIEGDI